MAEKEIKEVVFEPKNTYKKSEGFKQYYVTGAVGGFRNPYDFRLSMYNIESNDFLVETLDIKDNKSKSEEDLSKKLAKIDFIHTLVCELIMTEQAARELHAFLGKELNQVEKSKKMWKSANPN